MTSAQLSAAFFLQMAVILLTCRLVGFVSRRLGQPQVVGEMIAGVFLGPSLFGLLFPGIQQSLFPKESLKFLYVGAQLGVGLYMFLVGVEFDIETFRKRARSAASVSFAGMAAPFILGALLAIALVKVRGLFSERATLFEAMLFLGASMAITAFPVLARILKERNLLGTDLGTTAISCAAIDDVSAWLLLAVLTAKVHSAESWHRLAVTLLLLTAFVTVMLFPVRRFAASIEPLYRKHGAGVELISLLILIMLVASFTTERLGVHALFGAFVAGLVMPKSEPMIAEIVERIESLSLALLLPLFFAVTGLRTRIDLLTDLSLWGYTAAIIATAVLGKLAGAALTAKATGMTWTDSLALGVLMNTRGLVELVVLNAGLDLGVLSPSLFTMMVLMALVTTFMTTPILIAMKTQNQRT